MIIKFNSWLHIEPHKIQTIFLRALSKGFLKSSRLSAVTTSLGSLFQGPTTLWLKNLFLPSNLNLLCHSSIWSSIPSSLVTVTSNRRSEPAPLLAPMMKRHHAMRSPFSVPLSTLNKTQQSQLLLICLDL